MTRRIVIVGPASPTSSSIERILRHRGDAVVVSDDARHALLLLRAFLPDVLMFPRVPTDEELALLRLSSSRPIIVIADLAPKDAVSLVNRGAARVLGTRLTATTVATVLGTSMDHEGPVARCLAQAAISAATGSLRLTSAFPGYLVVEGGRVFDASAAGLKGQGALRAILENPAAAVESFVSGEGALPNIDISFGPADEALELVDVDVESEVNVPRAPATAEEVAALSRPKVLIVEDDIDLARLFEILLKGRGFEVHTAGDGAEGYAKVSQLHPDVVLTDIMMPRQTGWDLLSLIRNNARLRETRVLMFSHHTEMVGKLKTADSGADGYLDKALKPDAIVNAVITVVTPMRDVEAVVAAGASRFEGNLVAIGPQRLLRLLARRECSGRLAIRAGSMRYLVSLQQGAIIDAQCSMGEATLRHRDALRALLLVDDGAFTFVAGTPPATAPPTRLAPLLDELCDEIETLLEQIRSDALVDGRHLGVRQDLLQVYRAGCPEAVRPLVDELARGVSPRDLIMNGVGDPILVDSLVRDLFRKGVVAP